MTSRRSFLLGIGALVSASFVTRVKAHVLESARPLLLEPNRAEETLYLYDQSGWDGDWKWRVPCSMSLSNQRHFSGLPCSRKCGPQRG